MRHGPAVIAGFAILTLLNAADVVSIGFVGTPGNPAAEIIPGFALALLGLAATVPAWRGNRPGLLTMFGARAVSTVIAVIYFFVGDQPQWVAIGLGTGIILSLVGLALLGTTVRRASSTRARGPAPSTS